MREQRPRVLRPFDRDPLATRPLAAFAMASFFVSALALALAPLTLPEGYSVQRHAISESAAQALPGAWSGRAGLWSFGVAVAALALAQRRRWPRLTVICMAIFALSLFGSAAFAHRPWLPDVPVDVVEDALHSGFATGMGVAFCVGVLACALASRAGDPGSSPRLGTLGHLVVATSSVVLPLAMTRFPEVAGVAQRAMFVIAYAWFAVSCSQALRTSVVDEG